MNNNKLKKFIWDHRDEFDDEVPSEKVWQNIEGSFSQKKEKKAVIAPLYKWSMAAAAVLIISAGAYFMFTKKPAKVVEPSVAVEKPETNDLPSEFVPEFTSITKTISMKQAELKILAKDQPELYERFTNDINQLDSSYNILKDQLNAAPNNDVLLEAMIQNLQLQLNVLNQQLTIIHQIKQSKKNSHEKSDQAI
jgi:hypothetical protein